MKCQRPRLGCFDFVLCHCFKPSLESPRNNDFFSSLFNEHCDQELSMDDLSDLKG